MSTISAGCLARPAATLIVMAWLLPGCEMPRQAAEGASSLAELERTRQEALGPGSNGGSGGSTTSSHDCQHNFFPVHSFYYNYGHKLWPTTCQTDALAIGVGNNRMFIGGRTLENPILWNAYPSAVATPASPNLHAYSSPAAKVSYHGQQLRFVLSKPDVAPVQGEEVQWGTVMSIHNDKRVTVFGTLLAEEIRVASPLTADHVFDDAYDLRPLDEVEAFVSERRHLPGVPAAEEMATQGIGLGRMTALLLEKVEELTLYAVQLDKENRRLRARLDGLERALDRPRSEAVVQ